MAESSVRQTYQAWDIGLAGPFDTTVEALLDDWEGFRILLRNHKSGRMIRIAFDTKIAYQNRDETDVTGELHRSQLRDQRNFYRVINSEFVARFLRDTARSYIGANLQHFFILTESDCIDVLSESDPRVEDLKELAKEPSVQSRQKKR